MFNLNIPFYGIIILIALILNILIVLFISKKHSFTKKEIIILLFYENIGIILGAKILSFLENSNELLGNFNILYLGLSSYGAVIGALLFLLIFFIQFNKSIKEILYTVSPSIPLMYGIGKIGCFIVGCCHGINYSGFGSVVYNHSKLVPHNTHFFPVQILETILFVIIFIYMINDHIKNRFSFKTIGIGSILSGLSKFILDFLRNSHVGIILSTNQIISLIFIIIGFIILFLNKKTLKI